MNERALDILSDKRVVMGIRLVLGGFFIAAALVKIIDPQQFAHDISTYRTEPQSVIALVTILMPVLELVCGILIILGFSLGIRLVLGGFFVVAAIGKIIDPQQFAHDIYNYRMLPAWTINSMAIVMPWLELITGVLIIIGRFVRGSAFWLGLMLLVFVIALSSALVRGLDISCGCFGVGGSHGVDVGLLLRDIFMLFGALIIMILGTRALAIKRGAD